MSLLKERKKSLETNELHQDFLEALRRGFDLLPVDDLNHKRLQEGMEMAEYLACELAPVSDEDADMLSVMGSVLYAEAQVDLGDEALRVLQALSNRLTQLHMLTYALGFYRGCRSDKKSV